MMDCDTHAAVGLQSCNRPEKFLLSVIFTVPLLHVVTQILTTELSSPALSTTIMQERFVAKNNRLCCVA